MRFFYSLLALFIALFMAIPVLAADASLAGKYSDGNLTVEFAADGAAYTGTLTLGTQQFPASAHSSAQGFDGTFTSGGNSFAFTAAMNGDTLTVSTGGKNYTLKRLAPAVNPLANPAPVNPLAGSASDGPAGYTVEVSTDFGKSLITQKSNTTSVKAALQAVFPELADYFGNRPELGSAYQDAKDSHSGGATFSATQNGHAVRGFVSCKLHDGGGATVAVIYGRTDASKAEWHKLLTPVAQASAAPPAADVPADPSILLKNYDFPDGTGSVGVADGWKTNAPTAIHAVAILGPADQAVILGNSVNVQTPDSPYVKMMEKNQETLKAMQARNERLGIKTSPPPAAPPMMIAPFTDPVEAVKNMIPQFSKRSEFNHGPSLALDKIISNTECPTVLKDGKAADITYAFTKTLDGKSTACRARVHLQVCPIGTGSWMWFATSVQAPDSTFDHDLPIMTAMVKSLKVNQERATEVSNAENQQMRQFANQMARQSQQNLENSARQFQQDQDRRNATYQAQHNAQMQGYAQHNQQWQADELQKSRNAADFIETIKGTRTVYDTQTGTAGTADLNYVNGVVDSLNTAALDPNRFVQIPLRDELYPLPAGK